MIKGTLHAVCGHNLAGELETAYVFESTKSHAVTLACDPPLGETIWATIEGGVLTEFVLIPGEAAPIVDRINLRVALLRVVSEDKLEDEEYQRQELKKARDAADSIQNFWRSKGWRFWDLSCEGFLLPRKRGEPRPNKSVWCEELIERLAENSAEFREFGATYFHLWGNTSPNYCGWGQMPGKYSMTFSTCGVRTMCHEVGHNFGLGHSNKHHDESDFEYGNNSCVMGRGFSLSAAQSLKLRINTPREYFTLNKSRRFLMAPIEGCEDDLHPGMFQAAKLARGGRTYIIGCHRGGSGCYVTVEKDGKKPAIMSALHQPDSSFTVEDCVITLEDARDGYALVNVDMNDGLGNQFVALPDGLPPAVAPIAPNSQHEGIWWNPLLNGQGFDLMGDTFGWYTFNPRKFNLEKHTSQRWFRCKLSGKDCEIYTGTKDGGLVVCGHGRLSFVDDDNGVFQYRIRDEAFKEGVRNGSAWIERLTAKSGGSVTQEGAVRRSVYFHGDTRIELVQDFREPPTDYLGRQIKGPVYQRWVLNTGGRAVTARDGRFMESITPEFVPLGEK